MEPEGAEKSITEVEYDAAKERLMFLINPELPVNPVKDFDPGPGRGIKLDKLEAFKKRIADDQLPSLFNDSNLSGKVVHALNQWRKQREEGTSAVTEPVQRSDPWLDAEILAYCEKAESLHGSLPVAGFVTQLKVPIDI